MNGEPGKGLLTATHRGRAPSVRVGVALANAGIAALFLVIEEADAVSWEASTSMAVFPRIGDAVEILACRQVWSQERRVLVPRRVLEIVLGPGWPVHGVFCVCVLWLQIVGCLCGMEHYTVSWFLFEIVLV